VGFEKLGTGVEKSCDTLFGFFVWILIGIYRNFVGGRDWLLFDWVREVE
jgi:hypothetical protein